MNDLTLHYQPWPGNDAHCRVRIHTLGGSDPDALTVVVVTELSDNPGMSVTNAAELIATQLVQHHGVDPHRALWIEHYPDRHPPGMQNDRTFDETFDLVTFQWNDDQARLPRWHRVSRRWVTELTGEEVER